MASIGYLNQRIADLTERNKELNDEYEQYNKLKGELRNLIEAHIQCQKQKRNALSGAGLKPSRCMNSFVDKMNAQLDSGTDLSLANKITALVNSAAKEQEHILREIEHNKNQINTDRRTINKLRNEADPAAIQE